MSCASSRRRPGIDGFAQLAGDVDIGKAAHEAGIVRSGRPRRDCVRGPWRPCTQSRRRRANASARRLPVSSEATPILIDTCMRESPWQSVPSCSTPSRRRFGKLLRVIERRRQQHGEAIAGNARARTRPAAAECESARRAAPSTVSPTCMPKLSLMTCSWSASMYSAVHCCTLVRVGDHRAHALLECRSRVEAGGCAVGQPTLPIERAHAGLQSLDRRVGQGGRAASTPAQAATATGRMRNCALRCRARRPHGRRLPRSQAVPAARRAASTDTQAGCRRAFASRRVAPVRRARRRLLRHEIRQVRP